MSRSSLPGQLVEHLTATPLRPAVVLGADASEIGYVAARWAAREARQRDVPLIVLRVHTSTVSEPSSASDGQVQADMREDARSIADHVAEKARKAEPGVRVIAESAEGYPARVLVEATQRAGMVVVGNEHRGNARGAVLGSVAGPVAARASCPVVVVSGLGTGRGEPGRVVVGVSGGPESDSVISFAFARAATRQLPLRALLCWRPDGAATARRRPEPASPDKAERWLHESLAGWRERYPDVSVSAGVVRGEPANSLVESSLGAELLVVGRHAQPAYAWLGSVSQAVLRRAALPVAVVPVR